jgi:hypothetical protein
MSVLYYFGRNSYFQGDLKATENQWREAISLDQAGKYPELRFYLAVLLQEMGRQKEADTVLMEYLSREGTGAQPGA